MGFNSGFKGLNCSLLILYALKYNCVIQMDGRPAVFRISHWLMYCHTVWLAKHKYTDRNNDKKCRGHNSKMISPSREVVY